MALDLSCAGLGGGGRKRGVKPLIAGLENAVLEFWSPGTATGGGSSAGLTRFPDGNPVFGPGGLVKGGGCLGTCSQVHQHFMNRFCTVILSQKIQSQTVIREKLCKTLLYKKFAHKMLMILTPERRSVDFRAENLALSEDLFERDVAAD